MTGYRCISAPLTACMPSKINSYPHGSLYGTPENELIKILKRTIVLVFSVF